MSASSPAPGAQQQRLAAYLGSLAQAAGHADRAGPLKSYCTGLLLPGKRKSVEPMAARLAPGDVRQYCGQVGKQENCRVAVSLSVATEPASLPIAWRLYLPEIWAQDRKRRAEAGIPPEVSFATKPAIALGQIRQAAEERVPQAPVLADAAYGNDSQFRDGLTKRGLEYIVGIQGATTVGGPGEAPLPAKRWKGPGRRPRLLRRDKQHQPVTVKELAQGVAAAGLGIDLLVRGQQAETPLSFRRPARAGRSSGLLAQ
jgi:SRSO17 transposase